MNDKLNKIEELMVRRIKFAEESLQRNQSKWLDQKTASNVSIIECKQRMHALSEALGEIRKVIREKSE